MRARLLLAGKCLQELNKELKMAKEANDDQALCDICERIIALYQGLNISYIDERSEKTKKIA